MIKPMRPFSIVALLLLGFNAAAASDATLLESIAMVESGQNRKAIGKAGERGMYQIPPKTSCRCIVVLPLSR